MKTAMTEKKFQCRECVFCTKQDSEQQAGLCTEEHSPKNALGKTMKSVPLWASACRYGKRPELQIQEKPRQRRSRK